MSEETTTTALAAVPRRQPLLMPENIQVAMTLCADLAKGGALPERFSTPGACFVLINAADALGLPLLTVATGLYVVHGSPSWKGSFCRALVDAAVDRRGRLKYEETFYEWTTDAKGARTGCRLVAISARTGKRVEGTEITDAMVKAEGWDKNPKWRNMREQMFMYRAAAFFQRAHCPDATLGLPTTEEGEDVALTERALPASMADALPLDDDVVAGEEPEAELLQAMRDCGDEDDLASLYRDRAREWNQAEKDAYLAVRDAMRKAAKGGGQ